MLPKPSREEKNRIAHTEKRFDVWLLQNKAKIVDRQRLSLLLAKYDLAGNERRRNELREDIKNLGRKAK